MELLQFVILPLFICLLLLLLTEILQAKGMRGFLGKISIDTNSPGFYCESSTQVSLKETREFIEHLKNINSPITPVITPSFALTCTSAMMHGLIEIFREFHLPVQTHLSENKSEISWIKSLFPDYAFYTHIYGKHGL